MGQKPSTTKKDLHILFTFDLLIMKIFRNQTERYKNRRYRALNVLAVTFVLGKVLVIILSQVLVTGTFFNDKAYLTATQLGTNSKLGVLLTILRNLSLVCCVLLQEIELQIHSPYTAQEMKFSINNLFSKCDQIHKKLQHCSHLLKKSSMKNFIFCTVIFYNLI